MAIYTSPTDISNRALQILGASLIVSPDSLATPLSKNAQHCAFLYDKVRRAELRANPWNFSARRIALRSFVQGSDVHLTNIVAWNSGSTYPAAAIVSYNGMNWISMVNANLNVTPGTSAFPYSDWMEFYQPIALKLLTVPGATYYTGEVIDEAHAIYVQTSQLPTTVFPPTSPWVLMTIAELDFSPLPFIPYPLGRTTSTIGTAKNLFPLPIGYMRIMSQDPKSAGSPNPLTTAGMIGTDFEFEAGYLLTAAAGPIIFRFAGDVQNVNFFEDLFIEAVACRMAEGMCEALTQSTQKLAAIRAMYDEAVERAVKVNAIEAGATEPSTDDADINRGPTREKPKPQPQGQQR